MAFRVQNQIRQNASDIRNYLDDLFSWEEEVNTKSKKPTKPKKENTESHPIRGQALEEEAPVNENNEEVIEARQGNEENKESQTMRRDGTSIPDYYRAWDNYDAEREEQKLDVAIQRQLETQGARNEQRQQPQQPVNPMQQTSGAERNMKIVIKGGRSSYNEVESLKEKGNLFFKSLEFSKAIEMYTECLKKGEEQKVNSELLTVVYSNRAMAYLKLREHLKAEDDCTKALALNNRHVKSLHRRGQARRRLEKYKEALRDFETATELEPGNKEIQDEVRMTLKKIETIKEEQKKKMVLPISLTEKVKVKVNVMDFDPEKPEEMEKIVEKKSVHVEEKKEQNAGKNDDAIKNGEVVSEFITLKDVEGPVVHHTEHAVNEEESLKQKVHFRLDLNSVDKMSEKAEYQEDQLAKKPKKSAMKKRGQNVAKENVNAEKPKKVTNIHDLKTSEAVVQGKEAWQRQVIEEFEKTKTAEKIEEVVKPAVLITSTEFLNTWKHIKDSQEACEKFLMAQGRPDKFKDIFKVGVEFDYYMELIKFGKGLLERNKKLTFDILEGLSTVKRFDINVKSMIGSEKKVVREIIENLNGAEGVIKESVDQLFMKYKV